MRKTKALIVFSFLAFALAVLYNEVRWRLHDRAHAQNAAPSQQTRLALDPEPARGHFDISPDAFRADTPTAITGWAFHSAGVVHAELIVNEERRLPLFYGRERKDVAAALPEFPTALNSGFEGRYDFGQAARSGHVFEVEMTLRNGKRARLGPFTFNAPPQPWQASDPAATPPRDPFYLAIATSNVSRGGAEGLRERFGLYESSAVKVALTVPILYLRTTKGRSGDWSFDPTFDTAKKCADRQLVEDNLEQVIAFAVKNSLPVLFTLNGGIWADSACDVPEWDINDELEKDQLLCQWNQNNEVMADGYLKSLPGSQHAPDLARVLSYNIFNTKMRQYKKRNLQAASKLIAEFAKQHPTLFVGINLDSDTYMNPFFEGAQWYDYNPNTLKQFRHWLAGSGPYAIGWAHKEIANLNSYARKKPLSLSEISEKVGQKVSRWEDVDPPRVFPTKHNPFWKSPWVETWEHFRRHVIDYHYDELSEWVHEAGIAQDKIYSSQGFAPPREPIDPYAMKIFSPAKNYDSGGMSVEGAVPKYGRLGAVIYGDAARNQIRTETGEPIFKIFNDLSSKGWAVVEFHAGNIHEPTRVPTMSQSMAALRNPYASGARFISSMAWNGGSGRFREEKGYVAFTVIKDTPLEYAMKSFMALHFGLPPGAIAWGFGSIGHNDSEGWETIEGVGNAEFGRYRIRMNSAGAGTMETKLRDISLATMPSTVVIDATAQSGAQVSVNGSPFIAVPAGESKGIRIPFSAPQAGGAPLRVAWSGAPDSLVTVHRIALLP
jgi:hypothetical protein